MEETQRKQRIVLHVDRFSRVANLCTTPISFIPQSLRCETISHLFRYSLATCLFPVPQSTRVAGGERGYSYYQPCEVGCAQQRNLEIRDNSRAYIQYA